MTNEEFLAELKQHDIQAEVIAEVSAGRLVIIGEFNGRVQ